MDMNCELDPGEPTHWSETSPGTDKAISDEKSARGLHQF